MKIKWNTDVSQLMRRRKNEYPTKQTMNLCVRPDRTSAPATASLYILFALAVLLALGKVAVYDVWDANLRLEQQALQLEKQADETMLQLQEYNEVLERYIRSTPTQQEQELEDRMELLALIDQAIRPDADITNVAISGNQILLSFTCDSLSRAAELVSRLEQNPQVSGTNVDTATDAGDGGEVKVNVYFEVGKKEESQS